LPIFKLKNKANYAYEAIHLRASVHAPPTQGAEPNEALSEVAASQRAWPNAPACQDELVNSFDTHTLTTALTRRLKAVIWAVRRLSFLPRGLRFAA
jgi:hypothetical protein